MTPSIRTFLLINLLLSVTLITSLAIVGNLFLAHTDIQKQLDNELINTSWRMQALFSDYQLKQHNMDIVQHNLINSTKADKHDEDDIQFQLWNADHKLMLHSRDAPSIPLANGRTGLSTLWLHDQAWRVYTTHNPNTQLTLMVAQRANYRQQLENKLTQDSVLIMLITCPFIGLLIWVIVGRGLEPLKKIANEVSHRAPSYLKPVNLKSVPTEVGPLIKELNSLFVRLLESFQREKRFTADAAHELRTPLAALNTHAQIALRSKTPEERNQSLLKVLAGVNRSTHVVQQLLTLSRMVPETSINNPLPMDLSKEARELIAQLAPEAIAKNIELELIAPDEPAFIYGNNTAISILLRNLIDNAIRYSPKESSVVIKIEKHNDRHVTLHVIDNGPGIPEELRERVFERFFRVIGTKASGSGLGLSIVSQIAKLHNAEIKLMTPEAHNGLDFQVIFPSLKEAQQYCKNAAKSE